MKKFYLLLIILYCHNITSQNISISLKDSGSGLGVSDAVINFINKNNTPFIIITDENGEARTKIKNDTYKLYITHLSYSSVVYEVQITGDYLLEYKLEPKPNRLKEVVITASESKGLGSVSKIGRDAMQHLQPTSFNDLMELLPGGISKDPDMTSVNSISLRETGPLSATGAKSNNADYATNSLGTLFIIDGAPVITDANLQYTTINSSVSAENARNTTNKGVDMRSISTDDIETVAIIRGIPSAEYGNLTSGVIDIKKIRRATELTLRWKEDEKSTLLSLGKGFRLNSDNHILNLNTGFLNACSDPRNRLENYKRINAALRYTYSTDLGENRFIWTPGIDFSGSFDDYKTDPDLDYGNIDKYKSTFRRLIINSGFDISNKSRLIRKTNINIGVNSQFDKLERSKLVSPQRAAIAPSSTEPGEYDAHLIFSEYVSEFTVDGKPFSAFIRANTTLKPSFLTERNSIKAGYEWSYTKNYGQGQIYDLSRPLTASGWGNRPRTYKSIPGLQTQSFYIQDNLKYAIEKQLVEIEAGLRGESIPGLDKRFTMSGKVYIDPRFNARWKYETQTEKNRILSFAISAGYGRNTKMPTLNYLYPDPSYCDIIQLGYYNTINPQEYSRYNIISYKQDATNYELQPARNIKSEIRADIEYAGHRFWISVFSENLNSGFRYSNTYSPYTFKKYDVSTINGNSLTSKPELSSLNYELSKKLYGYQYVENGSKQLKKGIEIELDIKRIKPIYTAIRISGAWFKSTYQNSRPMFNAISSVIDNVSISDNYVGLYNWNDGRENEQLSTSILLDTQVPSLGLIFSTSVQSMWFISTQRLYQNGIPESYISVEDGLLHTYNDKAVEDNYLLQYLVYNINESSFNKYKIPPAVYLNLKITKKIGEKLLLSFFSNRLFDYTPDFTRNGVLIRRNVSPYFGFEMSLKI